MSVFIYGSSLGYLFIFGVWSGVYICLGSIVWILHFRFVIMGVIGAAFSVQRP